jgi:biopolymer transport protein ExbD
MRVRHVVRSGRKKVDLTITAMIDIVFLLLVFFVMTFQIVTPEGDFDVSMPQAARAVENHVVQFPLIRIRLLADAEGRLAGIRMGGRTLQDFDELRTCIRDVMRDDHGTGAAAELAEVELDCDYNLEYEHAIGAITAVSGYLDDGRVVKLVDKIRFAPPRG